MSHPPTLQRSAVKSSAVGREQLALLQRLSQEIASLETSSGRSAEQTARSSTGCAALDALLPRGGYAAGSVVEYLRSTPACGASTLAWAAAAAALEATDGFLVVVDTQHQIYPPSLVSHGIDLAKVIFVRPHSQADALWAVDQALRTKTVAAVIADLERIDDRSARRLQLAAECGQSLALLLRGWQARLQPSWAEVQWLVRSEFSKRDFSSLENNNREFTKREIDRAQFATPQSQRQAVNSQVVNSQAVNGQETGRQRIARPQPPRHWHVQLSRVRGGQAGRSAVLEVEPLSGKLRLAQAPPHTLHSTQGQPHERLTSTAPAQLTPGAVHLAAQLAHPAHRPAAAVAAPARRATAG